MKKRLFSPLLAAALAAAVALTAAALPAFADGGEETPITIGQSQEQQAECTCTALCTGDNINADCPVCSAEGAELDKVCVGTAPMLPVTALAAEGAPGSLYVAGQQITDEGYYTQSGGNWTKSGDDSTPPSAPYFHYTKGNDNTPATLTLSGATIQGGTSTGSVPYGAGIYAQCNSGESVSLTIELIGKNTITGYYGIYVNAEISADSYGTDASLTITGESNGSLKVSGSYHGIYVKSGTGGASLNINDASVVASSSSSNFGYAGVYVQSSAHATSSPQLSLKVNGGSLTASGTESSDGILFYVGSSQVTGATTSLTVTNNAIVDARNGGISASRILETLPTPTPTGDNSSGIVFDGTEGTVYGDVTLQEDLEIGTDETLTIPEGSTLNTNNKLTNNGTIIVEKGGNLTGNPGGKVVYAPAITNHPQDVEVKENETANFTVEATGTDLSYQWQQSTDKGSSWTNIASATSDTYTTGKTTMDMSGTQYRCVVSNSAGSVISDAATLTVNAAANVPVTNVLLDKTSLGLTEDETAQLNATVKPDNATNKAVTWSSSNENVATVDQNGNVKAVGAGTATITVTTEDGNKTATCTVIVTNNGSGPVVPPQPSDPAPSQPEGGGSSSAGAGSSGSAAPRQQSPVVHNVSNSSAYRKGEYEFWMKVRTKIVSAGPGEVIEVNARDNDKMPNSVMQALAAKEDVTLRIRWNDGEEIVIPSAAALQEKMRMFYPLSYLAKFDFAQTPAKKVK